MPYILNAPEEVEQRLGIARWQCHVPVARAGGLTVMRTNCVDDGCGASVMQEMAAIEHTPQRCRAKLAAQRRALLETIREAHAHVVEKKVRVKERSRRVAVGRKRRRVARRAAEVREHGVADRRTAGGG